MHKFNKGLNESAIYIRDDGELPNGIYNGKIIDVTIQEIVSFDVLIYYEDAYGKMGALPIHNITMSQAVASYVAPTQYFLLPMLNTGVKVAKSSVLNIDDAQFKWEIISMKYTNPLEGISLKGSKDRQSVGNYAGEIVTEKNIYHKPDFLPIDEMDNNLAKDVLPGDFGYLNGEGGVSVLSGGMSYLKASIVSQIMCLKEDDLVRLVSKNFEHFKGSGVSSSKIQTDGNILEEDHIAFTFGDALEKRYHLEMKKGKKEDEEFEGVHITINEISGETVTPVTNIQLNSNGQNHIKTANELTLAYQEDLVDSNSKKALVQLNIEGVVVETSGNLTQSGENAAMKSTKDNIEIVSARNVNLTAEQQVTFSSKNGFDIGSDTDIGLSGTSVYIKGDEIFIEGSNAVTIISGGDVDLDASGNVNVKCSKMKIQ